jgi:hypothetical protein
MLRRPLVRFARNSRIQKSSELKKEQAIAIIEDCLGLNPKQLADITMSPELYPSFKVWVAKSILEDSRTGTNKAMESLLNRAYGKPVETQISVAVDKVEGFDMEIVRDAGQYQGVSKAS